MESSSGFLGMERLNPFCQPVAASGGERMGKACEAAAVGSWGWAWAGSCCHCPAGLCPDGSPLGAAVPWVLGSPGTAPAAGLAMRVLGCSAGEWVGVC